MDLDGNNAKMAMGDTAFLVYVTSMTAINPLGIQPAANQSVVRRPFQEEILEDVEVMTCPSGCRRPVTNLSGGHLYSH